MCLVLTVVAVLPVMVLLNDGADPMTAAAVLLVCTVSTMDL